MKHGFIKVAAATPRVTVADCKANGEEILKAIHEMEKEHVKLFLVIIMIKKNLLIF